ncbi:MAG TPA: hypothetical protein VMF57_10700 [Solirubrobacteraceae bacterium]|nr:hypothetical protein [Solirubrobacteraceae bacterium]
MAGGNRKTTMAKLERERRLRERRLDKQAKKNAKKYVSPSRLDEPDEKPSGDGDESSSDDPVGSPL